jgi:hypothetical protein
MKIYQSIIVFLSKIISYFIFVFVVIPYRLIRELIKYPGESLVNTIVFGVLLGSVFSIIYFIGMILFYFIPQMLIINGYI